VFAATSGLPRAIAQSSSQTVPLLAQLSGKRDNFAET